SRAPGWGWRRGPRPGGSCECGVRFIRPVGSRDLAGSTARHASLGGSLVQAAAGPPERTSASPPRGSCPLSAPATVLRLMINFVDVSKQYGKQVLFVEASFQLNPGEKVGLVGPNGAGKTTVFRMITGEES